MQRQTRSHRPHSRPLLLLVAVLLTTIACVAKHPGGLERGKELYGQCSSCHGADGAGNELYRAPALAGLDKTYVVRQLQNFQSGVRGAHADDVAGLRMRGIARSLRSEEDIENVAEYIDSLPAAPPAPTLHGGDATRGQGLFASCTACHGKKGQGNLVLKAPPLIYASDWYLRTQIQNFRSGIRGTNPGDATGATMRPMAMALSDDQAILDVIAYIVTLRNAP